MTKPSPSTQQKLVPILQIILLFLLMIRTAAMQHYGPNYTLLDNEKPDLLHEMKPYGVWIICQINTTSGVDYNIVPECYTNNRQKKGSLKYAWYQRGTQHTVLPICTPLHSGSEWSWSCENNLSPSEVTPYRNCSVVCNEGYTTMNNVTARCTATSEGEMEWIWFGNRTIPYCQKITGPTAAIPVHSKPVTTSTTTKMTGSGGVATVQGLDENTVNIMPEGRSENGENTTNIDIEYVGYSVGTVVLIIVIGIIIIIVIKRRLRKLRNSSSSRNQSYGPVPQEFPLSVPGCCEANLSSSATSAETSFMSSSETTSRSDSNEKISKTGNQSPITNFSNNAKSSTGITDQVTNAGISFVNEIGNESQINKPVNKGKINIVKNKSQIVNPLNNSKQVEVLYQREVYNDSLGSGDSMGTDKDVDSHSSGSENSDGTCKEQTINFYGEGCVSGMDQGAVAIYIDELGNNPALIHIQQSDHVSDHSLGFRDSSALQRNDQVRDNNFESEDCPALMGIQENDHKTDQSFGLSKCFSLSVSSLDENKTPTPMCSGLIAGKRPDFDGPNVVDKLTQNEIKNNEIVDLPPGKDVDTRTQDLQKGNNYTAVNLQTAPRLGSSVYSSKQSENIKNNAKVNLPNDQGYINVDLQTVPPLGSSVYSTNKSSKNINSATTKQHKDKMVPMNCLNTTPHQLPREEEIEDTECNLLIKDILDIVFLQTLGYYLDPDVDNPVKSWYGLTLAVLQLSEEKVKTMRHHSKGNVDNGHFMSTIEYYKAQGKYISDIVQYFTQENAMRCDVVQFIKNYHGNCLRCNLLYRKVNTTNVLQNQIRQASLQHHMNNS